MKKLLKKIYPILKRVSAFVSAFAVFLMSLVTPSAAVDETDNLKSSIITPLFDYDYLQITYSGGYKAVFNLKDVFYDRAIGDDRFLDISLESIDGSGVIVNFRLSNIDLSQVKVQSGNAVVTLPYWALSFDMDADYIDSFSIGCRESIYNYRLLREAEQSFYDNVTFYSPDPGVVPTFSYRFDGDFYYPEYEFVDGHLVGRSLETLPLDFSRERVAGSLPIVSPEYSLERLASYLPDNLFNDYLYFSEFTSSFSFVNNAPDYCSFVIHYIPRSDVVSFIDYRNAYFPDYVHEIGTFDFVGWIGNAIGGFVEFEFFPGLTIGALLAFMIGIGCFVAFLRYFAGG